MMNPFTKLDCIKCDQEVDTKEEKQQEKLAQLSLASSGLQDFNQDEHIPLKNQVPLIAKLEGKKQTNSRKLSLKNTKRNQFRQAEQSKICSRQIALQNPSEQVLKSPIAKVTISYRPSSFMPSVNYQQVLKQDHLPLLKQQNQANFCNLNNPKQKMQLIHYQSQKYESVQPTTKQLSTKTLNSTQSVELTKTKEEHQDSVDKQNMLTFIRKKKVHFTQFKQNDEKQVKFRDNYSAFGSVVNTNRHISYAELQDLNSSQKTFIASNGNINQVSQIEDQKYQAGRAAKKNMTYFKAQQKRFIGIKTVFTLKSMNTPTQRSLLDQNFMQGLDENFRKKWLS